METLIKTAIAFLSRSNMLSDEMMTFGIESIAKMVNVDRFSMWRNIQSPDGLRISRVYHWTREEGGGTFPLPTIQNVAYRDLGLPLEEYFSRGSTLNVMVSRLPDAGFLKNDNNKSVLIAPVVIGNTLWGFAVFGNSQQEYLFDDATVEMMRSAAFLVANTVIRNEMERELAGQNDLNHAMFDAAPIGLTIFDKHGNIIDCNESILSMCNITKQYHIENFDDLFPEYQPDGSISKKKIRECMLRAIRGERIAMEWIFTSPAGEDIPCEMTLMRAAHNGDYLGLGYSYDLRNIKNMEADIKRLESSVCLIYDDPLTGIKNRRFLDENLKRSVQSLSRHRGELSFLLIDIDFFKNYNDTYGHIEGDKCLIKVAEAISGCVNRVDDFAARYGGEEFAVVLPNTNESGAQVIAEKLRQSVLHCAIPHKASKAAEIVTISIGVTTGYVDRSNSPEDFIKNADEMLYRAKQAGRNQYSFASLNVEPPAILDGILQSVDVYRRKAV